MTENGRPRARRTEKLGNRMASASSSFFFVFATRLSSLVAACRRGCTGRCRTPWLARRSGIRRGIGARADHAGANVVNLAILIGQRLGDGGRCCGCLGPPGRSQHRGHRHSEPLWSIRRKRSAARRLEGAAAAAVGLLIAMGVQSGRHLVRARFRVPQPDSAKRRCDRRPDRDIRRHRRVAMSHGASTVLCLAPLSILLAFVCGRSASIGDGHGGG